VERSVLNNPEQNNAGENCSGMDTSEHKGVVPNPKPSAERSSVRWQAAGEFGAKHSMPAIRVPETCAFLRLKIELVASKRIHHRPSSRGKQISVFAAQLAK
jgi:hypothetical protein